jgi:murein DD-endopeptidase MepM/ murein hydrolase activator NlpD
LTPRIPERDTDRLRTGRLLIGAAVAALCVGGGVASAQTADGTDDPDAGSLGEVAEPNQPATEEPVAPAQDAQDQEAEQTDQAGTQQSAQRASSLRLTRENVSRRKIYYSGRREAVFKFEIAGGSGDLTIAVVRSGNRKVAKRWSRRNVQNGGRAKVRWHGQREGGAQAKQGKYFFQVREKGVGKLSRARAKGTRSLNLYPAIFPVRGKHSYWDGWGAGRGHRGQDIGAKCGTKMVANRAGRVAYKAYNGGGYGYYLVINDKAKSNAYVYGHMLRRGRPPQGSRVKAGEPIGFVGKTGNASGCHLHFEYWDGRWGSGHATSTATNKLKWWDSWS